MRSERERDARSKQELVVRLDQRAIGPGHMLMDAKWSVSLPFQEKMTGVLVVMPTRTVPSFPLQGLLSGVVVQIAPQTTVKRSTVKNGKQDMADGDRGTFRSSDH